MAAACLNWMFAKTGALEIFGTPPLANLAACGFFRKLGFAQAYPDQPVFTDSNDSCAIFSLFVADWIRNSGGLVERGASFIDDLGLDTRADDHCRRHVGAAIEMISGGQPQKAAVFYNRWAAMCGRLPLTLVSISSVAFELLGAAIIFKKNKFEGC